MIATIEKSELKGEVTVPSSKSVAHRALIAAALCSDKTVLNGNITGNDVEATMTALKDLGATFCRTNNGIAVEPIKNLKSNVTINAKESGSTLRFFIPIVAALGVETTFVGEGRISERPLSGLLNALLPHGVSFDNNKLPLKMSGKLNSGHFIVDGSVSSQYVTGLLFALPLLNGDSELEIEGGMVSENYVDLTLNTLKDFGVLIERKGNRFFIKGNQKLISPKNYFIEGDYSSAAFFLVGGAINGGVTINGLDLYSKQSDREIIDILKGMGANIGVTASGITVTESSLHATVVDIENCPDLAPIVSIAMACASGTSVMKNVNRLVLKESDRLSGIIKMLESFKVESDYADNELKIFGNALSGGGIVDSQNDHRLAMSAAIGGSLCGKTKILQAESVKKSYPLFFSDFERLYGIAKIEG